MFLRFSIDVYHQKKNHRTNEKRPSSYIATVNVQRFTAIPHFLIFLYTSFVFLLSTYRLFHCLVISLSSHCINCVHLIRKVRQKPLYSTSWHMLGLFHFNTRFLSNLELTYAKQKQELIYLFPSRM